MCNVLPLPRSTFDDKVKELEPDEGDIVEVVVDMFHHNRKAYGTRKIKVKRHKRGFVVSRRRIGRIMKECGWVSTYTMAQYKTHQVAANEDRRSNTLNHEFAQTEVKRMVVSALTDVKVHNQWHDICVRVDWFHREMIGHRVGAHKDSTLVSCAFATVTGDLHQIQ